MKAITCSDKFEMQYTEKEKPIINHNLDEVIVKISAVGICGSDIHTYKGGNPLFAYPKVMGHEIAAVVEEVSRASNTELKVDDKVTILPYKSCGVCQACLMGKENCCASLEVLGVHIDGGMTEYLKIESKYVLKVDKQMTPDQIAMIEPLSISEHAVSRANIKQDELTLVIGAGTIGIGVMMMAGLHTKNIIVADTNDERLQFCKEKLNIKHTINALNDMEKNLLEITEGLYPTVIIDATGSNNSMNTAVNYLSNGGRLIFVGIHKSDICINDMAFHKRETTLLASRAANLEDFKHVISNISNGNIDPTLLITHESNLDSFIDNFKSWLEADSKLIKGILKL